MAKSPVVAAAVRRGSFFDPKPLFARLGEPSSVSKYHKNQIVFSQGDPVTAVYYIDSGIAKITAHSKHGKKAVVAILGTGDFFGEEGFAGQPRRTATVTTMTDCTISRLETPALFRLLREEPKFAELFTAYLAVRKFETEDDLADQLLNSVERRLARRLLLIDQASREARPETAVARITQDTLAAMVGTTQSRVSFFMKKFRRLRLVEDNGKLKIHRPLLTAFLDE